MMDRISQLPDFIVHHILSFLKTPTELVRMSVLSKTWFHLTASFPILCFKIKKFTSRKSFFKYVDYTTSRFCHQNFTAHKFKLVATIRGRAELDIVNKCLDLVFKNGVKELVIDNTSAYVRYRLPSTLLSVSVLQSLTICGCELPSSLMVDDVKFKSLIKLRLESVPIDDDVIKYLTTSCPLLQVVHIISCTGLKRFCAYGHQYLQEVWICDMGLELIDIDAPNLSYLLLADRNETRWPRMNLASCKKLTKVAYFRQYRLSKSNAFTFTDFLSNFPFIENLLLAIYDKCNKVKLSSPSLRTLALHSNFDLEGTGLNTLNMVVFNYSCENRTLWPLIADSTHLKADMQCYPGNFIDTLSFQSLRLFLDKKNGFKVLNLYIHAIFSKKFIKLEKLKAIELPPYELEHVELELDTNDESLAHIAFVEVMLWCCCPRSLTLRSSFPFEEQSDVVKFAHEKLLQQEHQRHTNIKIVSPSSSLLMALPSEGKAITFIKE